MNWFQQKEKSDLEIKLVHDLGNSLSCIKGYSQLLLSSKKSTPILEKETLRKIDFCSQQALGLMQDLMDQEALDRGDFTLRKSDVVLSDLLRQICSGFEVICQTKGVSLQQHFQAYGTVARIDPRRISQVVSNLLANAVRHTPNGGSIVVSLRIHGNSARISVQDNGDGIASENQKKIFQASYRAGPNSGSLGLGLSICRDLVELHGGEIEVASPGKDRGACFSFTLPLRLAESIAPLSRRSKSPPWTQMTGYAAATLALMLGLVTLSEQWLNQSTGIEPTPTHLHPTVDSLTSYSVKPKAQALAGRVSPRADAKTSGTLPSLSTNKKRDTPRRLVALKNHNSSSPESKRSSKFLSKLSRGERLVDTLAGLPSRLESQASRAGAPFDGGRIGIPAVEVPSNTTIQEARISSLHFQSQLSSQNSLPPHAASEITSEDSRTHGSFAQTRSESLPRDVKRDPLAWYSIGVTGLLLVTLPFALRRKSRKETEL